MPTPIEKHVLECKNISYMTAISTGSNWISKIYKPPHVFQILKNVSFTAKSGEIHAIVGVADSGKTTLLEALTSGVGGDIGGLAMLDKFMLTKRRFNQFCAYVNYATMFPKNMIVKDLMYYNAKLYLSASMSNMEINHRVSELMSMFDTIGYVNERLEDLTISAKRRVLTVLELLKDPILILIDECIADLSPLSSYQLIYAIQFYAAKYNRIVLISLRSIRSDLYHLLATVTFLFYGEVAYSGSLKNLPNYFKEAGYECPNNQNPASYYLSLLTIDKESIERVVKTQELAAKLVKFRIQHDKVDSAATVAETITNNNRVLPQFGATTSLLESTLCNRKKTSTPIVSIILMSRLFSMLKSNPSSNLGVLLALPIMGIVFSFFSPSSAPTNIFFWKLATFSFLVVQSTLIYPIYSKYRYFSFLESSCYSQTTSVFTFSMFFISLSIIQSFSYVAILTWRSQEEIWFQTSSILLLLSIFSFSILTICARYLKTTSNNSISYLSVFFICFIAGGGITRTMPTSPVLYYSSVINPFFYADNLLASTILNKTGSSEPSCPKNYPKYMCRLAINLLADLHTSEITTWTNNIILATVSFTYFAISLLSHFIEPSVQLQKHMKYKCLE